MKKRENKVFPYYQFEGLAGESELLHFISSGENGMYSNLSFWGDEALMNRMRLGRAVGFEMKQLTLGEQTHSAHVARVTAAERGRGGGDNYSRIPDADALVTDEKGICLMVLTADCVPILLYDPVRKVVAAIHAGWKGTVGKIADRTLDMMQTQWECHPENILAGIGPAIGNCCFEVGEDVAERFMEQGMADSVDRTGGKLHIDLAAVNKLQLQNKGVAEQHIELASFCTRCHSHSFFSYRGGDTAFRFGTGIMLR